MKSAHKIKVSLRSLVDFQMRKGLPRLIIHEKYESRVKWTIRVLTVIGILTSLLTIPIWYLSLALAILLFLFQQLLEKAVFQYTSIYVQPMLETNYDSQEWKAMAFAFPAQSTDNMLNVVGCAFSSIEYARYFFRMLMAWNYNRQEDTENNICLSFIVENDKDYSTYLYPNPDRTIIKETFKSIEEQRKLEKFGKKHQQLVTQVTFCKIFPYGPSSQLNTFIKCQDPKKPFWLKPFLISENNQPVMLYDEPSILKHHVKFKKRSELAKTEIEYKHGKTAMKAYFAKAGPAGRI